MTYAQPSSGYRLVFHDDFSASQISSFWWPQQDVTHGEGADEEKYWYISQNCFLRNGNLVIKTKHEDYTPSGKALKHFTSGQVNSSTHFRYGYFEARVKITPPTPKYQEYGDIYCTQSGFWPAFWVVSGNIPSNSLEYQEFDIFEYFGKICQYEVTTHLFGVNNYTYVDVNVGFWAKAFHKYALEWTPNSTKYYFDDQLVASIPIPPSFENKYCQMILNSAVGGAGGTPNLNKFTYPAEMEVDYVKIFQKDEDIAHIESLYALPASGFGRGYKICANKSNTFVMPDFPGTTVNFSGAGLNVSSTTSNAFFDPSSYSKITGGGMFKSCTVSASSPGIYTLWVYVTDIEGRTTSDNISIEVVEAPSTPTIITTAKTTCNQYNISTPLQSGVDYYLWEFGGQTISTGNGIEISAPYSGSISVSAFNNSCGSLGKYTRNVNLSTYYPRCSQQLFVIPNTNTNTPNKKLSKDVPRQVELSENSKADNEAFISPNPFKNEINIKLPDKELINNNIEVELIDIVGRTHLKKSISVGNNVLVTNDLPSGVYFLRTIKNGQIEGKYSKLIKAD